ncbi:ATP-binding protein [Myroides sp. JBRI-B21084]|uniref:ATP-binding protein n=1 Tax=Myroides sp. JBRI-B21084 TaxID=3119977 RepID=UPI0026E309F4|nr:ATP-binding protein [Paenimyroides cloacae]WKW45467.1 ATP-binding protein [Paenimyroides cloacae]
MIQKEQIQQRRQHIAEVRHADSVYRDIVARENEREDYEKRWFWELLQNAKDSVEENQSIKVKIEISENEISFSHTGYPFELDDILSLIIQGSSKNNKEGKTGRFGTGFMTTYLLSKEVYITGKLNNNQGCFHFLLNRNATDNEHFFKLQQESNKEFDESIREESYLGDNEFQTKFSYSLGEKGKATAKVGLQCLDELIPITQLFNEQIESVIVVENGSSKTFSKTLINTHELGSINEWEITTLIDGSDNTCLKAYIQKDEKFDACIITQETNGSEEIFPLTRNYPRLYYTFPLIGTEEIGIPIIINSTQFDPRVERDGIYLKKVADGGNESHNKEIINNALTNSLQAFAELFKTKKIAGIYELFDFKISKDLKWVDQDWFTAIKSSTIDLLASKEIINYHSDENGFASLNELIIPFTEKESNTRELWELLSMVKSIKVPISSELLKWVNISESITLLKPQIEKTYDLNFVWGVSDLIKFIERKESLEELESSITANKNSWLNSLYSLIIKIKGHFPLDIKICVNQRNNFRVADGICWDKCNDDELISISDLIELNFADKLFSREINVLQINGVENYTLQNAINDLKTNLNELDESDFTYNSNQECSARFLKWLISKDQKEVIKDLKILTGESKKVDESFVYDHFPKSEHLLLTPKPYFESNFPLYSSIVRDKDCLNKIYNKYLEEADYNFLNVNGFIHLNPLVIKTETATIKLLEHLIIKESDLNLLRDSDGQLKYKFKITYSDFAYLTASDGHIYGRNTTQKSSLERLKFLLSEAVEKDTLFDSDIQEVTIEGIENPIQFRECLWVYRAKRLNWVNVKTESEGSETKFVSETPSSKNLSEILKGDETLVKTIRGSRQQNFLNKLGVGVSDLIRNTLPTDELRLSWDKAITNMITSDADPELVQEIFNDPNIRKEYEKRLNERKLISRNQTIGKLIEDLFKEYIEQLRESGVIINIHREPFGSDYILTEESSDLVNSENQREGFRINNWLVELKATGKEHASMTPLQAKTATEQKDNYSLVVVPLDGTEPDIEYLRRYAKVISNIGHKIDTVFSDFNDVEIKKNNLNNGQDGISVSIEDQNIRFRVSSAVWSSVQTDIESFVRTYFTVLTETNNGTTTI